MRYEVTRIARMIGNKEKKTSWGLWNDAVRKERGQHTESTCTRSVLISDDFVLRIKHAVVCMADSDRRPLSECGMMACGGSQVDPQI